MTKKQKEKIDKLMMGRYIPTLADSIRLYKMYEIAEYTSETLSDIYRWLAQKPIQKSYKGGTVYLRAEALNGDGDDLCVHYIYVNDEDNIFIEDKLTPPSYVEAIDFTLTQFFNCEIKDYLRDTIYELESEDDDYYLG